MKFNRYRLMEGDPGAAGGGTPPATGQVPAATPPGSEPSVTSGGDWTSGFEAEMRGYVQNKGFKGPADVLESYRNFEKLMGAPKERLVTLPENMTDMKAMQAVYDRLGRPKEAKEYGIKPAGDEKFVEWAQSTFHELGLSTKQAQALAEKWNGYVESGSKAANEAYETKLASEDMSLKKEWGHAYDQNVNMAKAAAKAFGFTPEKIDALERTMGYAETFKFLHGLQAKIGEGDFVDGGKGHGSGFNRKLTPEQALSRINERINDAQFREKYLGKDAEAIREMNMLHEMAYGDAPAAN